MDLNILTSMLVGVSGSLVASTMFLIFLYRIRPSLDMSPYIAEEKLNGKTVYVLKIVNRTRRPLINIKVELVLIKTMNVDGGPMQWLQVIPLSKSEVMYLPRFDRKDPNADYALRVSTNEDLMKLWGSDSDFLEFSIVATDSVSGFSKAIRQAFRTKRNTIKEGSHVWGASLEVR